MVGRVAGSVAGELVAVTPLPRRGLSWQSIRGTGGCGHFWQDRCRPWRRDWRGNDQSAGHLRGALRLARTAFCNLWPAKHTMRV